MKIKFYLEHIDAAAAEFLAAVHGHRVICFHCGMGAGKTTFIGALCKVLGVASPAGSPTFSIINEYRCQDGHAVYHMDFYRLNSEAEAVQAGVEDALFSNSYCFVEWPEKAAALLPGDALHVRLRTARNEERELSLNL